jgi:hypothetical protein
MKVDYYHPETFEKIEVEVEDYLYKVMEMIIDGSVNELERTPICIKENGSEIIIGVQKPGRQIGEECEFYRITVTRGRKSIITNPIEIIQEELEQSELTKMMSNYFDEETIKRGLDKIIGELAKKLR